MPMLSPSDVAALEHKLSEIDRGRAENEARLASAPPHTENSRSYLRQELESEASELLAERELTVRQIKTAKASHAKEFRFPQQRKSRALDPDVARQSEVLDIAEAEQRENIMRFARTL